MREDLIWLSFITCALGITISESLGYQSLFYHCSGVLKKRSSEMIEKKKISISKSTEKKKINISKTQRITLVGIFSALAAVLMYLEIPFFFAPPEAYKLDFSEVPVLIASFLLGPIEGIITEVLKILIKLIIKPTSTAFVGEFANLAVGITFVLPASVIYKIKKTRKSAVIGMCTGTLVMTLAGCFINAFILLPAFAYLFGGVPVSEIIKLGTAVNPAITDMFTFIVLAVVPVNILKGVLVSLVVFFIYKPITKGIRTIIKTD